MLCVLSAVREGDDLEEDLSGHGEAVGDDGLLVWRFALPAVQLQAPAARQQALTVHLRGGDAGKLTGCRGKQALR